MHDENLVCLESTRRMHSNDETEIQSEPEEKTNAASIVKNERITNNGKESFKEKQTQDFFELPSNVNRMKTNLLEAKIDLSCMNYPTKTKNSNLYCEVLDVSKLSPPTLQEVPSIRPAEFVHKVAYIDDFSDNPIEIDWIEIESHFAHSLDSYQKEAIKIVQRNEDILVCAPTSAGKTVIAEFAIKIAAKRIFYTSPIKALSNQKFSHFSEKFDSVGLITGDAHQKTKSKIILMTTEILHDILQKNGTTSEELEDVDWVVFDEAHYLGDEERGFIYEEIITLLPKEVKMIFLSATFSNSDQFIRYVSKMRQQPCHCITALKRPVPLHYYALRGTALKVVNEDNLQDVLDEFGAKRFRRRKEKVDMNVIRGTRDHFLFNSLKTSIKKLSEGLEKENFVPAIFFCFKRLDCELYLSVMRENDFTSSDEKKAISDIIQKCLDNSSVKPDDRKIPLIQEPLRYVRKGMAIHHSGLIPVVKEITEKLFEQKYIKVLFATNTFSTGVNMPAKTVIITELEKYDGHETRLIRNDEFQQMAGRAGRRGIDKKGHVITILNSISYDDESKLRNIFFSDEMSVNSAYHLSVSMILNHLNPYPSGYGIDDMIKRSFLAFQCEDKNDNRLLDAIFTLKDNIIQELTKRNFVSDNRLTLKGTVAQYLGGFPLIEAEILEDKELMKSTSSEILQLIICLICRIKNDKNNMDADSKEISRMLTVVDEYQKNLDDILLESKCTLCISEDSNTESCPCSKHKTIMDFAPHNNHDYNMIKAVKAWAEKKSFMTVYSIANKEYHNPKNFEGDIIHAIRKCEDILIKLKPTAEVGLTKKTQKQLSKKFQEAYQNIHKGLVVVSSIFVESANQPPKPSPAQN